mmetsp:Transcript_67753/g.99096  ORF Transcript_67753/g.99096 Transcript_67753/m.99096 type:complete len:377 (+) Transcript_67753:24-1154(+)
MVTRTLYAALGLLSLISSVDCLWESAHTFPGFLSLKRSSATPLLATVDPPNVRNPVQSAMGFIAGFDLDAFGKGVKDFAIGGVSGAIAQTIVFPIDLAKTRIQDEVVVAGAKAQYSGVIQTIMKVAREDGVLKLWRGVTPVLLGSTPECALEIGSNNLAREKLAEALHVKQHDLPMWGEVACGGVGGFFQVIATCPMERVKILQQVMGDKAGSVGKIVSELGFAGLYQGVKPCYFRDIIFAGLYFGIYHETRKAILRDKLRNSKEKQGDVKLGPLDDLVAGLIAGVPAAFVTTPLDVIKTRMQSCGVDANGCRIAVGSMSTTARELWAEGQMAGLFKGVYGRVGRVAPQMALCLVLYEAMKQFFDEPPALAVSKGK